MKKVKIMLSTAAVVIAVGASLASSTARNILVATFVVKKNTPGCEDTGRCTIITPNQVCRMQVGTNTFVSYASITTATGPTTCAVVAQGTYIPN